LPLLLAKKEEREHVMTLLEKWGLSLEGITKEQRDMVGKIIAVLSENKAGTNAGISPKKKAKKK